MSPDIETLVTSCLIELAIGPIKDKRLNFLRLKQILKKNNF